MLRRIFHTVALCSLAGCFSDATPQTGACPEGDATCPCFSNSTCNGSLVCDAGTGRCVGAACEPGQEGCPCDNQMCEGALRCSEAGLCDPASEGGSSTSPPLTSGGTTAANETSATTEVDSETAELTTLATSATEGDVSSGDTAPVPTGVVVYEATVAPGALVQPKQTKNDVRENLDALCIDYPLECSDGGVALMSISEQDVIKELVEKHPDLDAPIVGPALHGSVQIAGDFASFLTGPLEVSLVDAGVVGSTQPFAWTGASADGALGAGTCAQWTSEVTGSEGTVADGASADVGWLSADLQSCGTPAAVLCACW